MEQIMPFIVGISLLLMSDIIIIIIRQVNSYTNTHISAPPYNLSKHGIVKKTKKRSLFIKLFID
jgi:hypothetical protein